MTIQQLNYVVAVDRHRHFAKAADSCFVTQSTLTLQLKKLEDEVGQQIFDRSSRPVEPTEIGLAFVEQAKVILKSIQDLKNMINDDRTNTHGEFKVAIIPTLAPYLLPLFISEFIEKHPQTHLTVEELQSEQIIHQLKTNELDIGILACPLNDPELREIMLFKEPFLLYSNDTSSITSESAVCPTDLKSDGLWLLKHGHCFRNQTLNICGLEEGSYHQNLSMEGGSIETIKKIVEKMSGYTLVPELSLDSTFDHNNVLRFKEPEPVREIGIVVHKNFTREALINELKHSILEQVPDSFVKNERVKRIDWR